MHIMALNLVSLENSQLIWQIAQTRWNQGFLSSRVINYLKSDDFLALCYQSQRS
jgi:hypothetical protein